MRNKREKLIDAVIVQMAIDLEVHEDEGIKLILERIPTKVLKNYLSGDIIHIPRNPLLDGLEEDK